MAKIILQVFLLTTLVSVLYCAPPPASLSAAATPEDKPQLPDSYQKDQPAPTPAQDDVDKRPVRDTTQQTTNKPDPISTSAKPRHTRESPTPGPNYRPKPQVLPASEAPPVQPVSGKPPGRQTRDTENKDIPTPNSQPAVHVRTYPSADHDAPQSDDSNVGNPARHTRDTTGKDAKPLQASLRPPAVVTPDGQPKNPLPNPARHTREATTNKPSQTHQHDEQADKKKDDQKSRSPQSHPARTLVSEKNQGRKTRDTQPKSGSSTAAPSTPASNLDNLRPPQPANKH